MANIYDMALKCFRSNQFLNALILDLRKYIYIDKRYTVFSLKGCFMVGSFVKTLGSRFLSCGRYEH